MLEELFRSLQNTTNPYTGFLGELYRLWASDAGQATLVARWNWERLPQELEQQATLMSQQATQSRESRSINDEVNARLGALGISPRYEASSAGLFGLDPGRAMFVTTMGNVRMTRGEPQGTPAVAEIAELVLSGRVDPMEALWRSTPAEALHQARQAFQMMEMIGTAQQFRLGGVIAAAMAVPNARIPGLVPELGGY